MKKDGYVKSQKNGDGLLEWSVAGGVALDKICTKPAMDLSFRSECKKVAEPEKVEVEKEQEYYPSRRKTPSFR